MTRSYRIRTVEVRPAVSLSPMSGVTCSAFRRLIRHFNPGAVGFLMSEFISVEGMTRRGPRSLEMMRYREEERPFSIQIFGYDIDRMRDAALMVQDAGVDFVDINSGCPSPKVVRKGGGCELMRQPLHLAKIIREIKKSISIPLTLKIRSGWDSDSINAVEIAKMAESEGVEALAIHGRTRTQLYRGEADWSIVSEVAKAVSIPVIGSGDITNKETAERRFESGAAGLYVGRAAIYNPLVFTEIAEGVSFNLRRNQDLVLKIIEKYIEFLLEDHNPRVCIGRLKQLVSQMCSGYEWRKDFCRALTFNEQREIMNRVRNGDFKPANATREELLRRPRPENPAAGMAN